MISDGLDLHRSTGLEFPVINPLKGLRRFDGKDLHSQNTRTVVSAFPPGFIQNASLWLQVVA